MRCPDRFPVVTEAAVTELFNRVERVARVEKFNHRNRISRGGNDIIKAV